MRNAFHTKVPLVLGIIEKTINERRVSTFDAKQDRWEMCRRRMGCG
jgi:hypothetical protein